MVCALDGQCRILRIVIVINDGHNSHNRRDQLLYAYRLKDRAILRYCSVLGARNQLICFRGASSGSVLVL